MFLLVFPARIDPKVVGPMRADCRDEDRCKALPRSAIIGFAVQPRGDDQDAMELGSLGACSRLMLHEHSEESR